MPSSKEIKKGRGRPRAYDAERAQRAILETFWSRGFAGTRLDHLAEATGMHRPSLYAAFGDKKQMYRGALAAYTAELRERAMATLSTPALADALTAFYRSFVDLYLTGPDGPCGCLVACTAPAESVEDDDIRADLAEIFAEIDGALAMRIQLGQMNGELSQSADPQVLGRLAASVLHSLAVRARAGETQRELYALADATVALIAPPVSES